MESGTLSHKRTLKNLQGKYEAGTLKPNALDNNGLSLVHQFSYDGQVTCLKWLLKHGGSATARSAEGCVAAHYAAAGGHLAILHVLKEEQVESIEMKDNNNTYPLYIASQEGQLDCVIWLTKHSSLSGSEPAKDGMTAVHAAAQEGHLDCVRYLIQLAHCSPVVADYSGCTPLHFASAEGHWKVARWLLEHGGAQGDKKDKTGSTAVHLAAEYNRLNVLKVLAKQNIPLTLEDDSGRTPIDICKEKGHTECVEFLKLWQGRSPAQNKNSKTRASLKKVRFDENEGNNIETQQERIGVGNTGMEEDFMVIASQLSEECLQEQLKRDKEEWMKANLGNTEDSHEKNTRQGNTRVERQNKGLKGGRDVTKRSSFKDKNIKYQVKDRSKESFSAILGKLQKRRPQSELLASPLASRPGYRSHPDLIESIMKADRDASVGFRRRPSLEFFQELSSHVNASKSVRDNARENHVTRGNTNNNGQLLVNQNGAVQRSRENLHASNNNIDRIDANVSQEQRHESKKECQTKAEVNPLPNLKPEVKDKIKDAPVVQPVIMQKNGGKVKTTDSRNTNKEHPQRKIKLPKGFIGILPKSTSDSNLTSKTKENSKSSKPVKKSASTSSKNNKQQSNGHPHKKKDLPPGTKEHYLIQTLPLPSLGSHRTGGHDKLSFYSYNLTNERKQSSKWMSMRESFGTFFSTLRGKKREKLYEVNDMLGSDGSFHPKQDTKKFNISKSLPIKKRKSISLEHMPNFSSSGEQIKVTNAGKSTVKKLTNLQPGYTEPDIYKLTSMALDHTLKGKMTSPPQEPKGKPRHKPEESLDFVVANKDQTGFQLDSLQVNNKGDQLETGNALMW